MTKPTAEMQAFLTELADLFEKYEAEAEVRGGDYWNPPEGIQISLCPQYSKDFTAKLRDRSEFTLGTELDAELIRLKLPKAAEEK